MQQERANSKVYTNSTGSMHLNAGSGSATQLPTLKKSATKSKFFKEDPLVSGVRSKNLELLETSSKNEDHL
jgi:hypothetical protein